VLKEARLDRIGRRVAIGVVVAGLLVIAGGVLAFMRWDDIKAWGDAPAVLDAHRTMQVLDLPAELDVDTTLTACDPSAPVRCAWTDLDPSDAVEALVGALRDAGLEPGSVVCDSEALPMLWGGGPPECGAPLEFSGATAWVMARKASSLVPTASSFVTSSARSLPDIYSDSCPGSLISLTSSRRPPSKRYLATRPGPETQMASRPS